MIPLLALGIPGSATTAVMLGALQVHGIRPGPLLFSQNIEFIYTIFAGMFITNFIMVVMGAYGAKMFARAVLIPYRILSPIVFILSCVGAFAIRGSIMDLFVMLIAGIAGYVLNKNEFPTSPIVLGVILGPMQDYGAH
jgi:putative tricarboxylic transport membrane protein